MSEQALAILGTRARSRRLDLGLSQEALARRAGLHWTFIGQVERGTRNVSILNLLRIAKALEVEVAELVDGLQERAPAKKASRKAA